MQFRSQTYSQILVWKYPSLVQVAKLTGHSYRVLYLAMSPDGESIVTGAGDETLRFWNVFSKTRSQKVMAGRTYIFGTGDMLVNYSSFYLDACTLHNDVT